MLEKDKEREVRNVSKDVKASEGKEKNKVSKVTSTYISRSALELKRSSALVRRLPRAVRRWCGVSPEVDAV